MGKILEIFREAPLSRRWGLVLAQLAAGLTEGIGLVTLLPIVNLAISADEATSSPMNQFILEGLERVGLEPRLGPLLVIFAVAMCVRSALQTLAMQYVGWAAAEVSTQLRREIIDSVLRVRWRYLVGHPMGRTANALSMDATRASKCYVQVAVFVAQVVRTAIYVGIAFVVSFSFALGAFVTGIAVAGSLHFLVRIARKAGWRQTARTQQLINSLSDTLNNIKPIKAMAREAPFGALMERRTVQLRKSLRVQVVTTESLKNAQDALVAILLSAGFYVAVEAFAVPVAEVLVAGYVVARLISSMGKLQTSYQKAAILEAAFIACRTLITAAEAEEEPNPGTATPTFERGLTLERVSFAHGEKQILDEVDLEVPAGSLTVLTGPSGSGKTTITDLIIGLFRLESGSILVDGRPLQDIDLRKWRRMLAYVPQEHTLLHDTVLTNVTLGDTEVSVEEVQEALRLAGAWDFVSSLPEGLDTVVGEKGAKLSGGQRQRIGLARALVVHPKLLILDEVTSALDQPTAVAIAQQIKDLSRGLTVLAVTHRSEFLEVADRIYEVDGGRVREVSEARRQLTASGPR